MANPVLIAKLALVAADPKTWQKIIIACISIFIISAALLGSCGAMTFTDLGFDCSQLFSAKLNEYSAVFDSGARINDKLLYIPSKNAWLRKAMCWIQKHILFF